MGLPMNYRVDLPGGGHTFLQDADEVELFNEAKAKYIEDYHLSKLNDLALLGAILMQQILMYRAQRRMSGVKPQLDNAGVPTGEMIFEPPDSDETAAAVALMNKATDQLRGLEKQLGIDKVTRESSGAYTIEDYIRTLKRAAHERAIHISKRFLMHEAFANGLRWRLRGLYNWDAEDRAYHNLTPDEILKWCDDQLKEIEEADKKFAHEKGRMFVGKL